MKKYAPLLILTAGILWGSMGLFVRTLTALGLGSWDIVFLRTVVTSLTMILYLGIFRRELFKIRLKDIWCFLGTGVASIAFFNFCYFKAITVISLSAAAILLYTAPVIVMVLSRFLFREPFTKRKGLALLMTVLGCALVTGVLEGQQTLSPVGILMGLGAGLGYALYSIFGKFALERGYHSLTITFYTFLIAALATCVFADFSHLQVIAAAPGHLLFAAAFGILCTVLPYLLYTLGLQQTDNSQAAIIASVEPIAASLLGIVLYGEPLTLPGILGIALVLGGIAVCST